MFILNVQPKDSTSIKGKKLALLWGGIIALSWGLLTNSNPIIAQENVDSNEIQQEINNATKNLIYVHPRKGNDNAVGNQNSPLKTITQALKAAQDNTVISLASGTYSENTGETFPLIIRKKITLQGTVESQGSNIIIEGSGDFISPTGAGQNVAIAIIKDGVNVTGVTVTNPYTRGHGIWIESANPTISYSSFIGNGNTGVSVNGNSQPILENNYFFNNLGNGLLVYGTSYAQVRSNRFERTGFGVSVVKNAAVTLEDNNFQGNRIGVIFEGKTQGILRNNRILSSFESGLVAIANSRVDLGTKEKSGGNVFRGNGKYDIQNITKNSIVAVGTVVQGETSGTIDFYGTTASAVTLDSNNSSSQDTASNLRLSPLRAAAITPIQEQSKPTNSIPQNSNIPRRTTSNSAITSGDSLPAPPSLPSPNSVTNDQNAIASNRSSQLNNNVIANNRSSQLNNNNAIASNTAEKLDNGVKELVFSAPTNDVTEDNLANNSSSIANIEPPRSSINSLGDVVSFSSPATVIKYRVLAETSNSSQQSQVRSLFPDAFRIVYQGKNMLQVGAFSQRSKAENASRSLTNLGLNSHILSK